jgi:hypothetical protein
MPLPDKDKLAEQLLGFIKNKEVCFRQILDSMQQVETIGRGMDTLIKGLEGADPDKVDMPKVAIGLAKSMRKLAEHSSITSMLALVYVGGSNFDTDVATVMSKLGKGSEAMREIWKKKMGGK